MSVNRANRAPTAASGGNPSPAPRRAMAPKPAATSPRQRVSSTRACARPRSAGRRVVEASMVASTVADTATPTPPTHPMPTSRRPSIEITTVVPAKTTARPAESMAVEGRVPGGSPRVEALAVPGHDEERVVDPDAETHHQREQGGVLGDVDHVAQHHDRAGAGADPAHRHGDREAHGQHRPEGDDQHDDGERKADQLGRRRIEHARGTAHPEPPRARRSTARARRSPHRCGPTRCRRRRRPCSPARRPPGRPAGPPARSAPRPDPSTARRRWRPGARGRRRRRGIRRRRGRTAPPSLPSRRDRRRPAPPGTRSFPTVHRSRARGSAPRAPRNRRRCRSRARRTWR